MGAVWVLSPGTSRGGRGGAPKASSLPLGGPLGGACPGLEGLPDLTSCSPEPPGSLVLASTSIYAPNPRLTQLTETSSSLGLGPEVPCCFAHQRGRPGLCPSTWEAPLCQHRMHPFQCPAWAVASGPSSWASLAWVGDIPAQLPPPGLFSY